MIVPRNDTQKSRIKLKVEQEEVEELIQDLWISDKITRISSVPYKDLREYIGMADVVILPTYAEWFGLAIAESCALKKNLITTNVWSVPEVAWWNVCFVNPWNPAWIAKWVGEFISWIVVNRELKKYLWNDCVANFLEVYDIFKK
jgi:glycosyltransferase involved in cell wall biosynthesis